MKRLFAIHVTLPNPLWYIVAAAVYLWRRQIKRRLPERIRPDYVCEACGKSIGQSYWGWCSKKCLRELCNLKGLI